MSNWKTDQHPDQETFVEDEVKEPRQFKVLLHNDDYSTMDFVIRVLQTVFRKTEAEARSLMWTVHNKGMAVCGVYTQEVAETKVALVREMARAEGYPLRSTMEEV